MGIVLASTLFTFVVGSGMYKLSDNVNIVTGLSMNGEPVLSASDILKILPELISALVWGGLMLPIFYIAGASIDLRLTASLEIF